MERLSVFLDNQFEIMKEYSINAEEMMFIYTLFLSKNEGGTNKYLFTYFNEIKKSSLPRDMIKSLIEKKVLKPIEIPEAGQALSLDALEFEAKFINKYFVETLQAGRELYDEYPPHLEFGQKLLPARNITKGGFLSLEAFFLAYSKAIRHSKKKHKEVLESLVFAKANNLINCGISEYLITRRWEEHITMLEKSKKGEFLGYQSYTEDI